MSYMSGRKIVNWDEIASDLDDVIVTLKRHGYGREEMIARQKLEEAGYWLKEASKTRK